MTKYFVLGASLLVAVVASCEVEERKSTTEDNELGAIESAIIDGDETNYESWQAVLMVTSLNGGCTGTLIHPKVVLTAGHCVKIFDEELGFDFDLTNRPSNLQIRGGAEGQIVYSRGASVRVHPSWDGRLQEKAGDLALILLEHEISEWEPHRLRDFPMPEKGDEGIIVGYGGNITVSPSTDGEVLPIGSGVHRWGTTTLREVNDTIIEIGGLTNTCEGDSGGPLFTRQDGEWVVTGVTSFGTSPCYAEHGGYSVNLLAYCAWLNQTMLELTGEDLGLSSCVACQPSAAESWGQPCGATYPCCPEGTSCRYPEDFSRSERGYCAPTCCSYGQTDRSNCSNISAGEETCLFLDEYGSAYCGIGCDDDADCPQGTNCKNKPFTSEKICIATEDGPGGDSSCEPDSDADTEIATDSETGSDSTDDGDTDSTDTGDDTHGDPDSESGGEIDTDEVEDSFDGGSSEDTEKGDEDSSCQCRAAGKPSRPGLVEIWTALSIPFF